MRCAKRDIAALEKQYGSRLRPQLGAAERTLTGHIDFLQVRKGAVHILDYKPDARTNKPIAQLRDLRARAHASCARPEAVRHQVRVVQRRKILGIRPAQPIFLKSAWSMTHE